MLGTIQNLLEKFNHACARGHVFMLCLVLLVAVTSFLLGQLAARSTPPPQILIEQHSNPAQVSESTEQAGAKNFVGSTGSDRYHLPDCPGATQIAEANKVWFTSKAEAQAAGYVPAGNCPGLQ